VEKLMTTIPAVLTGTDILIGFGVLGSDQLLALEQIVVDNEIAHICQRLAEGVECTPEKEFFDDIARVGPGGHFLGMKSTRVAARSGEFYTPKLVDHNSYETWMSLGKPSMLSKAREKVIEILESPVVDPIPEDVRDKLEKILRRAEKEIPED
jgi:trimethylamine--corrinoid protein Co-methyltransferase